jgi:ABC-type Zn uptake system ZnuABC Zn-binding protein ZnuA
MTRLRFAHILILLVILSGNLAGCRKRGSEQKQPEIAVTNSYLQCVVEDLCQGQIGVFCLTPPGMCPGHFDISPAQVNQLAHCRILLRFDFQKSIDESLSRMKGKGLKIGSVRALPGMCVPETYLAACRDVCNVLSRQYPERQTEYNERLKLIKKRLENLSNELLTEIKQSDLESAKILASDHQAKFCKWLGLDVVATFVGSDIETASNIHQCLQKGRDNQVRFVIANKQEGTALAETLAEQLRAKVIVFSNFPQVGRTMAGPDNFDQLLTENVQALLKAAKPR